MIRLTFKTVHEDTPTFPTLEVINLDAYGLQAVLGRHLLNVFALDNPPPGLIDALATALDALATAHDLTK